jgi:ABC-type Fe3+-hydroxamate transport system substrate-binding protein
MTITDQTGRTMLVPDFPKRIISLVPSQTELLADLGLSDRVVGVTRFCVHPSLWMKNKAVIGGTKKFDFEQIAELNPDLILANKEENYKDGIDILAANYPTWISDIYDLGDALEMIRQVGAMTSTAARAESITYDITHAFETLRPKNAARVLYLIWRKPWMGVGSNTFIHSMLRSAGWSNCLDDRSRYPEILSEEIQRMDPDLVLLSSEPYPFKEKHIEELKKISPRSKVVLVDGEMFSWYGSRLRFFPDYFNSLTL